MFQRKLEKLEKYLPYFFRDWTITYIYHNAPKYGVNIVKMIKPYLSQQYSFMIKWQSLSPDFDNFVMTSMVLRITRLPLDFKKL